MSELQHGRHGHGAWPMVPGVENIGVIYIEEIVIHEYGMG